LSVEGSHGPTRPRNAAPTIRLSIRLPRALAEDIVAASREAAPLEACGLLIGRRHGSCAEIHELLATRNLLASPRRYEIAPEDVLAADRRARRSGQLLLGAWHSHPQGRAAPSDVDRAEAWPDWCYLIAGLGNPDSPELRAWRLLGDDFLEDSLEIA
jgi:proteasome lid subunit RPN8/RPN11